MDALTIQPQHTEAVLPAFRDRTQPGQTTKQKSQLREPAKSLNPTEIGPNRTNRGSPTRKEWMVDLRFAIVKDMWNEGSGMGKPLETKTGSRLLILFQPTKSTNRNVLECSTLWVI